MSELLGKFFGKEKQQGGKNRDKSPAVSDRPGSGAGASTSAQGNTGAADFCTYTVLSSRPTCHCQGRCNRANHSRSLLPIGEEGTKAFHSITTAWGSFQSINQSLLVY